MNDKEALKVLENLSIDYEGMDDDEIAEMDSAVDFAIAALEEKVASQLQDCKQVGDDLVSRQALCEYALNQKDKSVTPNDIMRFPPAKTEIIRCRDCRWRKDQSGSTAWLPCRAIVTPSDFYCARAERRTDG